MADISKVGRSEVNGTVRARPREPAKRVEVNREDEMEDHLTWGGLPATCRPSRDCSRRQHTQ